MSEARDSSDLDSGASDSDAMNSHSSEEDEMDEVDVSRRFAHNLPRQCVALTTAGQRCRVEAGLDKTGRCHYHSGVQCRGLAVSTGQRCRIRNEIGSDGKCQYHSLQGAASEWGEPRLDRRSIVSPTHENDTTATASASAPKREGYRYPYRRWMDADMRTVSTTHVKKLIADGFYCPEAVALAIRAGRVDIVAILLEAAKADDRGLDPMNLNGRGWSILHAAVSWGHAVLAEWIIRNGLVDVHAVDDQGRTPLHVAENSACAKLLLDNGAKVGSTDKCGQTPVHTSCSSYYIEKQLLELLLDRAKSEDIDVNTKDEEGNRPLHLLLSNPYRGPGSVSLKLVLLLLDAGAHATETLEDGKSPLGLLLQPLTLFGRSEDDVVRSLFSDVQVGRRLVSGGANWDESCERLLGVNQQAVWEALRAIRVGIKQWEQDRENGAQFTSIPIEVFHGGEGSVQVLLKDLHNSLERYARSKICVVGPSGWGKTSFIKAIRSLQPVGDNDTSSTVGIDRLPFTFEVAAITEQDKAIKHEVTFWDFAGQDVYQVAHALFFSESTLYLLCVNMAKYATHLRPVGDFVEDRNKDAELTRFVYENVLQWVALISFRQRDAKFVIVGTHEDQLVDKNAIKRVKTSLEDCLTTWAEERSRRGESTISVEDSLFKDWIVMSSKRRDSVLSARAELERIVVECGKAFEMGTTHREVIEEIKKCRSVKASSVSASTTNHPRVQSKSSNPSESRLIKRLIIRSKDLRLHLCHGSDLAFDDCQSILQTLRNLGDIMWYEDGDVGDLKDYIILDADIVLRLVKEVISHEYLGNEPQNDHEQALKDHGKLSHKLLMRGELWPCLDYVENEPEPEDGAVRDDDQTYKLTRSFKSLLKFFQLAYPADGEQMNWDSDLIVPTYWQVDKVRKGPSPEFEQAVCSLGTDPQTICWSYKNLPVHISATVFKQFAVGINCSMLQRKNSATSIECSSSGEFAVRIELMRIQNSEKDIIQIKATAREEDTAWSALQYFVVVMEKVLEPYPGLHSDVRRKVIDSLKNENSLGSPEHEEAQHGSHPSSSVKSRSWLPADFSWYTTRSWTNAQSMELIRIKALMRQVLANVKALEKEDERLPAVWMADYNAENKMLKLEILSDVSLQRFHDPIEIDLSHDWVEYEAWIGTGLGIFSNVIPDVFAKIDVLTALLKKGFDVSKSALSDGIKQQRTAQQLSEALAERDRRKFSSRESRDLLLKLLKHHDETFDEFKIGELSRLKSARTNEGQYIWAHKSEIDSMPTQLEQCDPREVNEKWRQRNGPMSYLKLKLTFNELSGSKKNRDSRIKGWLVYNNTDSYPTFETEYRSSSSDSIAWTDVRCDVLQIPDIRTLRSCSLHVEVKRQRRFFGPEKTVGEGSVLLGGIPVDMDPTAVDSGPLEIKLEQAGKASGVVVRCSLTSA